MRLLLFLLACTCCSFGVPSEPDYRVYHRQISRADSLFFLAGRPEDALRLYDRVLSDYPFVFASDFFTAAQIACYQHDTPRQYRYLGACFESGLNSRQLALSPLFRRGKVDAGNPKIEALYAGCRKRYLTRIDGAYQAKIYQLYAEDQIDKNLRRDAYSRSLRQHLDQLAAYVAEYGFPSDRRIGIDDSAVGPGGRSLAAWYRDCCRVRGAIPAAAVGRSDEGALASCVVLPLLVHHPCAYQTLYPLLDREIRRGNLHPRDAALLYDNAFRMAGVWPRQAFGCVPPGRVYAKVLRFFHDYPAAWRAQAVQIDSLRRTLYLCPVRQDSVKAAVATAHGFYTRCGFWECR